MKNIILLEIYQGLLENSNLMRIRQDYTKLAPLGLDEISYRLLISS